MKQEALILKIHDIQRQDIIIIIKSIITIIGALSLKAGGATHSGSWVDGVWQGSVADEWGAGEGGLGSAM